MDNLKNEFYNIKDLRIVMINKDYLDHNKDEYIRYFKDNFKFIVEKCTIEEKVDDKTLYNEFYTECITNEDFIKRTSSNPFSDVPKMFSIVSRIPSKYFTEEEIKLGKISAIRIYQILQEINTEKTMEEQVSGKELVLKKNR